MGLNLITRNEYKAYVGINSPNQDSEIDIIIPKVSELVKTYCRQTFVDNYDDAKSDVQHGGVSVLLLKEHPIISVLSVELSIDNGQTYSALEQYVDWVYDPVDQGIRSLDTNGFKFYINGYKTQYTYGYASPPEDLKLAVMDLVTYYRKNDAAIHSTKAPGTNSVQIEYVSTTNLPAHIKRVLDLYKVDFI